VTKPFAARELLARIKAVIRRTRMLPPNLLVPLDTARPSALVTPLHRAARETALSPADVR